MDLKLKQLEIYGVGRIRTLSIDFNDSMNIICGPNGIGKTTILECIGHMFAHGSSNRIRRNSAVESGSIRIKIIENEKEFSSVTPVSKFVPGEYEFFANGTLREKIFSLVSLKSNRTFQYQPMESLSRDRVVDRDSLTNVVVNGIDYQKIKNWFVSRYLFSKQNGALSDELLSNFELAKRTFSVLEGSIAFSRIDPQSFEIMLSTSDGEIYYEYLSDGYKSILAMIFGIIKEIEERFVANRITAEKFGGLILIDEIELHLHPQWQREIIRTLIQIFPKAQFVVSTHSPHVIQGADADHIIALANNEGDVVQRDLSSSKVGYKGWTVEEILEDVMGMGRLRTDSYDIAMGEFELAVVENNFPKASAAISVLEEMLHPNNHLRKLLRFQLATIDQEDDSTSEN